MSTQKRQYLVFLLPLLILGAVFLVHHSPVHADTVSITGSVAPKPSDLDFNLSAVPTSSTTLHENDRIDITIRYRSHLGGSENLRITASWDKGLVQGSVSNYLDAFQYVISSATTSDDGTIPVVNLLSRTITWNIVSVAPSASFHTVTFSLRVPESLPTLIPLDTHIHAQAQIISTLLPQETLDFVVQGLLIPTATPTPTVAPVESTITPTPKISITVTPTTQPTVTPQPLTIDSVSIRSVSDVTATIGVETNKPASIRIGFGPLGETLSRQAISQNLASSHFVSLDSLTAGTDYWFKVTVTDQNGDSATSDYFQLKTAETRDIIPIQQQDVSVVWNQIPVSQEGTQIVTLPRNEPVTVSIHLGNTQNIAFILMRFENQNILGISTNTAAPAIQEVRMVEVLPGVFSGELAAPQTIGKHQLILEIHTINGGISTQLLPYTFIISPVLTIVNGRTHEPIENASVTVERYVPSQHQFTSLGNSFALATQTNEKGELSLALPSGQYQFTVSAAGYGSVVKKVTLGSENSLYPTISLFESAALGDRISYYTSAFANSRSYIENSMRNFFSSKIAQDAAVATLTIAVLFLAFVALSIRINVSIFGILYFPVSLLWQALYKSKADSYTFRISEHKALGKRIAGTVLLILDKQGKQLVKRTADPRGTVRVPIKLFAEKSFPIKVFLYRPGYYAYPVLFDRDAFQKHVAELVMEPEKIEVHSLRSFLIWFTSQTRFVVSDFLMIATIILVTLFTAFHGIYSSASLLLLTAILIFVWIVYVVHRFEHESGQMA